MDSFEVPAGWTWAPLIRWGDPIFPDAPEFDFENQTAAAQERQFGYNNDFCGLLPLGPGSTGSSCSPTTSTRSNADVPRLRREEPDAEQVRIGLAAHGTPSSR